MRQGCAKYKAAIIMNVSSKSHHSRSPPSKHVVEVLYHTHIYEFNNKLVRFSKTYPYDLTSLSVKVIFLSV